MHSSIMSGPPSPKIEEYTPCEFPRLVEFMLYDKDNDFIALRRFRKLQLYSLLDQQRRLILLEKDVLAHAEDNPCELDEAMAGVTDLVNTYNKSLLQFVAVSKLPAPRKHMIDFFLTRAQGPTAELQRIVNDETKEDLISSFSAERGPIHRFIDNKAWLKRWFETKESKQRPGTNIILYHERYLRKVENVLINVAFCVLVLVPIGILPQVRDYTNKVIVIIGAVLLTTVLASGFSDSTHKSSLGLMAAYTAILVVFLSNTAGPGS